MTVVGRRLVWSRALSPRPIAPLTSEGRTPAAADLWPPRSPPIGRWEQTTGARGTTAHVARLTRPEDFLQVGERGFWRAEPRTLDAVLDEIDTHSADMDAAMEEPYPNRDFVRFRSRTYRWAEARGGRTAGFERAGSSSGPHFDGVALDGDVETVTVRRPVRVPRSR